MHMTVTASLIKRTTPPTACHVKLLLPIPRHSQGRTHCQKRLVPERLTFVSHEAKMCGEFFKEIPRLKKRYPFKTIETFNVCFSLLGALKYFLSFVFIYMNMHLNLG